MLSTQLRDKAVGLHSKYVISQKPPGTVSHYRTGLERLLSILVFAEVTNYNNLRQKHAQQYRKIPNKIMKQKQ